MQEILSTHEDTEDLLEIYLLDCASLETRVAQLQGRIQSAENLVMIRLDTVRNDLLTMNTVLTVLSCSIAIGAYITGVFGMNLDNTVTIQPVQYMFPVIFTGSFYLMVLVFYGIIAYLEARNVLKITSSKKVYYVVGGVLVFYVLFIAFYLFYSN